MKDNHFVVVSSSEVFLIDGKSIYNGKDMGKDIFRLRGDVLLKAPTNGEFKRLFHAFEQAAEKVEGKV